MTSELLEVAWQLVAGQPSQGAIRRAVSTIYYGLFHVLAQSNADVLAGSAQHGPSWLRVYRSLEHATARRVFVELSKSEKHPALVFAETFVELQEERHEADYNPSRTFDAEKALLLILQATQAIEQFRSLSQETRLDLATRLLFKNRP